MLKRVAISATFLLTAQTAAAERACVIVEAAQAAKSKIGITFNVGGMNDKISGTAHLVEHLKFKFQDHSTSKFCFNIENSDCNAYTEPLMTGYWLEVPNESVAQGLEAIQALQQPTKFDDKDFEVQRSVVLQEYLQRTNGNGYVKPGVDRDARLYQGSALQNWPAGTPEKLRTIKRSDAESFDAKHYPSANVLVTIFSSLPTDDVKQKATQAFGGLNCATFKVSLDGGVEADDAPLRRKPGLMTLPDPPDLKAEPVRIEDTINTIPSPYIEFTSLLTAHYDFALQANVENLVTEVMNGRLRESANQKLGEDLKLTSGLRFDIDHPFKNTWRVVFSANLRDNVTEQEVMRAYEDYVADISKNGISQSAFDRIKKRLIRNQDERWRNPEVELGRMSGAILYKGYDLYAKQQESLASVTLQNVNDYLKTFAIKGRTALLVLRNR